MLSTCALNHSKRAPKDGDDDGKMAASKKAVFFSYLFFKLLLRNLYPIRKHLALLRRTYWSIVIRTWSFFLKVIP